MSCDNCLLPEGFTCPVAHLSEKVVRKITSNNRLTQREDRPWELARITAEKTEQHNVMTKYLELNCPYNAENILQNNPLLRVLIQNNII